MKGIRLKAKIKPEYVEDITKVLSEKGKHISDMESWTGCKTSILKSLGDIPGHIMIPNGVAEYEPEAWYDSNDNATDGFKSSLNTDTLVWTVQCSFTDRDGLMDHFLYNVLGKIIDEAYHIEMYYSLLENDTSTLYKLENEKVVPLDYGIHYPMYDDVYDEDNYRQGNIKYCDYKETLNELKNI